jgi:serine/threonine-protein kinase
VTLFQMLCGRLPFEGESMTQLMFAIASNAHPQIRALNPNLPPAIDAIIDKALAKDADVRYQTGAEFAAAIRELRKGGTAAHAPA